MLSYETKVVDSRKYYIVHYNNERVFSLAVFYGTIPLEINAYGIKNPLLKKYLIYPREDSYRIKETNNGQFVTNISIDHSIFRKEISKLILKETKKVFFSSTLKLVDVKNHALMNDLDYWMRSVIAMNEIMYE